MSLRAVPMVHVRVQIPNRDAVAATRAIAAEGLLHLVDIAHGKPPYDASPPGVRELYAAFRDLNTRVRAVCARLGIQIPELTGALRRPESDDFAADRERIELVLQPIEKKTDEIVRALAIAQERDERRRRDQENDERLRGAEIDVSRLKELRFAVVKLGVASPDAIESLAAMLAPAPFAILPLAREEEKLFFAAATATFASARLEEGFKLLGISDCGAAGFCPPEEDDGLKPAAPVETIRAEHEATLIDLAQRTELATLLLQAQTYFATAGRFVVVSGWVPRDALERLQQRIRAATGGRAVIDAAPAESFEGTLRVPILHRNPLLLRPFQKLVDLYGTPSYREVQPTTFFAISFLLMFGLMFGDVGHGAVLFCAGWFLFRYMPRFLDYGILLMEAGTSSALFGVLYGSVFGIRGWIPTLWLEPMEDLSRFMVVAVILGVITVSGGLILNIINSWRSRDFRTALLGSKGATGAVLYWIALVIIARAFVPKTTRVPEAVIFILLAIAMALLIGGRLIVRRLETHARVTRHAVHATPWWLTALEASVELVDTLFSFFANTISFVRVAAFAAVHAGVFIAIFALADTISHLRMGGVLSIGVHVAANVVVILLEGLTVSVQVLRLEYYEFFGKFFRGGGEAYKPLTVGGGAEEVHQHVS